MRITNNILQNEALRGMQDNLRQMHKAQAQVASGLRIRRPSDDPTGTGGAMRARNQLRALDQYRRNIDSAQLRLSAEESVLDQVTELLTKAKELAIGSASGNAEERKTAYRQVDSLIKQAVDLGNTKLEGRYLFGGDMPDKRPFRYDGLASPTTPPEGTQRVEVREGHFLRANHDGQQVFVDSGVLSALRELREAFGPSGDQDQVSQALPQLDEAFNRVQDLLADVGVRSNQLELATTNIEALDLNLRTLKSDLEDVDLEEAVSELVNRQVAYQAALMATSRIMSTTLTDYLR